MTVLVTAAQMRAIERAAIESGVVTGLELMERAGAGAVDAILAEWPDLADSPHRAAVLCGPGNNGGDGFVVARLLAERGWEVDAFLLGDPDMPPDARASYDRWAERGGVHPLEEAFGSIWLPDPARGYPVRIDALFGTGLTRPLPDVAWNVLAASLNCRTVALDVPSMLQSDSGRALPRWTVPIPPARLTIAFHAAKPGHFLADGPSLCGKLAIVDIGLADGGAGAVRLVDAGAATALDKRNGHKFDHGHALVLAGGVGRGGAARLAARAALRVGAGLVTVAPPPAALIENAARLDAIMLRAVRDAGALREMLEDGRIDALCLGPGLGTGEREAGLLRAVLGAAPRATVLDGDALTLLAGDADLFEVLHEGCVLTPHAGEFARLFPDVAARLDAPAEGGLPFSKVDAAREAAARAGCTVVFKGPDTVIAEPGGRAAIHAAAYERAAPWLATAGSGDVLAGLIAGLLARGWGPFGAACAAAWLHVECALAFGPGLIAEDLPGTLPRVLARLEGRTPPG